MAFVRMTLEQIRAAGGGRIDRARLDTTTEEDIRRHMIEDGEDPDAERVAALRARALASLADPAPTLSEEEADARLAALFSAAGEPRD